MLLGGNRKEKRSVWMDEKKEKEINVSHQGNSTPREREREREKSLSFWLQQHELSRQEDGKLRDAFLILIGQFSKEACE